jgi:signal transduction histidine kinase
MALRNRQLGTFYRLAHLLAAGADGVTILRAILRETLTLTGCRSARILLLERDGRTLRALIGEGVGAQEGVVVAAEISPWGDALREGRLAYLPCTTGDSEPAPNGGRAFVAIPLLARGDVLGLLALQDVPTTPAKPYREPFLEALADLAAHSLHNAALSQEQLRQKEELCILIEIGRDITSSLDLDEVLRRVVRHATRLLRVQVSSLMLLDETATTLHGRATYGTSHGWLQGLALDLTTCALGEVVRTGSPLAILDVRHRLPDYFMRLVYHEGLRSLLCVPLKISARLLGLLLVYTTEPRRFREDEVELLAALAAQSATAIENARLYRAMLDTQERLRQSERLAALGRMSAGLAHEIRNPLQTMQLLAYAMHKDCPTRSPLRADLEVIRNEIGRLTLLVDQFLDFARPKQLEVTPQKLQEIMEETLLFISAEARRRKIRLHKKWRGDLPPVRVDGAQIKQVFLNVLLNALQAMPSGGLLEASIDADGTRITTDIRDHGEGIPAEIQVHLCTPFFTTKPKGVGLGLSISQRIIENHRGTMAIVSHPGEGTTVRISLPLTTEQIDE